MNNDNRPIGLDPSQLIPCDLCRPRKSRGQCRSPETRGLPAEYLMIRETSTH